MYEMRETWLLSSPPNHCRSNAPHGQQRRGIQTIRLSLVSACWVGDLRHFITVSGPLLNRSLRASAAPAPTRPVVASRTTPTSNPMSPAIVLPASGVPENYQFQCCTYECRRGFQPTVVSLQETSLMNDSIRYGITATIIGLLVISSLSGSDRRRPRPRTTKARALFPAPPPQVPA